MTRPRSQAAYMAEQMRTARSNVYAAKRWPHLWRGLPASFCMDPAGRRRSFDAWRERHRAMVARLPRLP